MTGEELEEWSDTLRQSAGNQNLSRDDLARGTAEMMPDEKDAVVTRLSHWLISARTPEGDTVDLLITAPSKQRAWELWKQTLIARGIPPAWLYMLLLPERVVRLPPVGDTEEVHAWGDENGEPT